MNQKTKFTELFLFILIFSLVFVNLTDLYSQVSVSPNEVPPTLLLEYETKYEKERAEYVQKNILDRILGPEKSTVIIDIILGVESKTTSQKAQDQKVESKRKLGEVEYVLPGIPKQKSVAEGEKLPETAKVEAGKAEESKMETNIVVRKQTVTVIYDETIPDDKIKIVKDAIISSLMMDLKKDVLEFKKAKFTKAFLGNFINALISLLQAKYFLPLLLSLLLASFLFGPFSKFLKDYVRTLRERPAAEISVDSKMEGGLPTAGGLEGAGATKKLTEGKEGEEEKGEEKEEKEEKKYNPFNYITDENVHRLVYLIAKEPPEVIATVLSYLKPEHVREVLKRLSSRLQAEVAICMAQPKAFTQEEVMKIDTYLKERIDFSIGGMEQLLILLDEVDKTTRDNILEYLSNEKPDLYKKVRRQIFLFEDIPTVSDSTMQIIIRELKIENVGRALVNASEEIINKFFTNMSEGARALVKEEIEYSKNLTEEQIINEREKILDTVKKLEREGRIVIRKKEDQTDEIVEETQQPSQISNVFSDKNEHAKIEEYYNYGVELFNEEKFEDAIPYFQYCIELDKNYWQAYQYLGNIYYSLGHHSDALSYYEKTIQLNPADENLKKWVEEFKSSLIKT